MTKTTMCIGLFDKVTKVQEINTIDAFKVAANIFAETTGGATITEGTGVYTHDDGTIIIGADAGMRDLRSGYKANREGSHSLQDRFKSGGGHN